MRLLRDSPRWFFLAILVYAPWAYGGTPPDIIPVIEILLDVTLGVWMLELVVRRRWPRVPKSLAIISALLVILGWAMLLGARSLYDPQLQIFVPIRVTFPFIKGSVDFMLSFDAMCRITLLLGVAFFVADMAQQPGWLLRTWWTTAGTGASIAFLGLLQKGSGAKMLFWQPGWSGASTNFFATYYYHANAGAFLNLILPPVAGLAIRSMAKREKPIALAIWLSATLIVLIAVLANTSRMAQAIGILLLLALALGPARTLLHVAKRAEKFTLVTGAIVIVITIAAIAQATRLDQPIERWNQLTPRMSQDARWLVAVASLPAVRDAGFFGFGPGTCRAVIPHYAELAKTYPGRGWRYLHQDYLQTLIEWGWIGSSLWAVFLFGGIAVAWRNLRKRELFPRGAETDTRGRVRSPNADENNWKPRRKLFLQLALLSLGGIALHALVDFPFQILSLQLYVVTYLGFCWSSVNWKSGNAESGAFG